MVDVEKLKLYKCYLIDQWKQIEPYSKLIGDGISPVLDALITAWEIIGKQMGLSVPDTECFVEWVMYQDYEAIDEFIKEKENPV